MKLTNKTLIAALLLAVTLTGCDSLKNKLKNTEDKKVEEAADDKTEKKEGEEDAENTGSTEKEDSEDTKEENKEDKEEGKEEGEDKDKKASEAETDPGSTDKEKLEDAIFNNRVQARAAEILLKEAPNSLSEESKAKLEKLVEDSTKLIEKAEALIDSL